MTSLRAALLVAVFALAGVGVFASPADAHALLERSYPAAGATLPRAPRAMLLFFTEAPDPGLSTVSLLDSAGQPVPGVGELTAVPGNPQELRATLPQLANGVYTVNWRTVSEVDGHLTADSFAFGIGVQPASRASLAKAATGGQSTGAGPAPAGVAGRWLLYWGLALLVAGAATGALVFGWRLPREAWIVIAAGWLVAAAGTVTMIFSERAAVGVPFAELFRSAAGRSLLVQAVAVAVCGVAAVLAVLRPAGPRLAVLGTAAAGALFVHAQAGHAETQSSARLLNVADQWLHMLAAGIWAGGLVWLLLGLRGLSRAQRASAVRRFSQLAFAAVAVIAVTGVLRAVPEVGSPAALVSTSFGVVLLIKSGLFVALMGVAWRNRYRLVPRIAGPDSQGSPGGPPPVMGGAAADRRGRSAQQPPNRQPGGGAARRGGAAADRRGRSAQQPPNRQPGGGAARRGGAAADRRGRSAQRPPNRQPGGGAARRPPREAAARTEKAAGGGVVGSLRRSVTAEVAMAAVVLVAAAVLSGLPPASFVQAAGRRPASPSPSVTVAGSDFAATVRVRLTVSPGRAGPNVFQVQLRGYDSGRPVPARRVRLEFSLPSNPNVASSLNLTKAAGGTWTGQGTNLSIGGRWNIDVVVQEAATAVDVLLPLDAAALPREQQTGQVGPGPVAVVLPGGRYRLRFRLAPNRASRKGVLAVSLWRQAHPITGARVRVAVTMLDMDMGSMTAVLPETTPGTYARAFPAVGMRGRWGFHIDVTPPHAKRFTVTLVDHMGA